MTSQVCPHCDKKVVKNLKMHLRYCDRKPLEEMTVVPPESDEIPEQAVPAILAKKGVGRTFLPFPSRTAPNSQETQTSWYLRDHGALPEDAFNACGAWSPAQRNQLKNWGMEEVTPSRAGNVERSGRIIGAFVVLDAPPPQRWERVKAILEKRRGPALEAERLRLEDLQTGLNDAMGIPERAAARNRVRNCTARIAYLERPVDEDGSLYRFFVAEAKASRIVLEGEQSNIRRMVDESVAEAMGLEEEIAVG